MPRIDFYYNYELQATIKLSAPELLIGRSPSCAICIPDDRVSRTHAVITAQEGGHQIENRGANGTKLNGAPLEEPQLLRPGDTIFISRYILIYQPDEAPPVDSPSTVLNP